MTSAEAKFCEAIKAAYARLADQEIITAEMLADEFLSAQQDFDADARLREAIVDICRDILASWFGPKTTERQFDAVFGERPTP